MKNRWTFVVFFFLMGSLLVACGEVKTGHETTIKAYDIDFNWGDGGPNAFAEPGLWADANPKEHINWYKGMFVVSNVRNPGSIELR